jgi:hypothetical protein
MAPIAMTAMSTKIRPESHCPRRGFCSFMRES